jgi:gliding motility associated protien GldN
MKSTFKWFGLAAFSLVLNVAVAQIPEDNKNDAPIDFTKFGQPSSTPKPSTPTTTAPQTGTPQTGTPQQPSSTTTTPQQPKIEPAEQASDLPADPDAPLDGIVERKTILEKQVVAWPHTRESDMLWSKVVWRVIDVREKINQPFTFPEEPFFNILLKGIQDTVIRAYKSDNDKFKYKLSGQELQSIISSTDTIQQIDPTTYETKLQVVYNKINWEDVRRYRVKEHWFFDKQRSELYVRILGISPLKDVTNEAGEFMYEKPLFWVYYPNCREYLARHRAFIEGNDSNPMSWDELFELRRFSSYIWKESNVQNRRLQDYLQGIDLLLEGEKIKAEIFNFEHDLWSY